MNLRTKNRCKTDWTIIATIVNGCHLAVFQSRSKVPLLNDLLKIIDNGIAINSVIHPQILLYNWPAICSWRFTVIHVKILSISGVKYINLGMGVEPVASISGMEVISSQVKQ